MSRRVRQWALEWLSAAGYLIWGWAQAKLTDEEQMGLADAPKDC